MDHRTSSESSLESLSPTESCVSSQSTTPNELRRSSDSTVFSLRASQRRRGFKNKMETGIKTLFRRFSRTHTTLSELEVQILSTLTHFDRDAIEQW